MTVQATALVDADSNDGVIVAGTDATITITVTKDGNTYDVSGATITCTLRDSAGEAKVTGHSVTLTTAESGIVTLTLTDTETAQLSVPPSGRYEATELHYGDLKIVESGGAVAYSGTFTLLVARPATG